MTLDTYKKNISKKKKDWIAEQAALAFVAIGNYPDAATVVKDRIEKRPANLRLWDLLTIMSVKNDQARAAHQQLVAKYNSTSDKKLASHLAKFANADWPSKLGNKDLTWNNQKI